MKRSLFPLLFGLILLAACTEPEITGPPPESSFLSLNKDHAGGLGQITVMTRNIYIGADVDVILAAEDPNDVPLLTAQAFQTLLATDFHERAVALAAEIVAKKPHLIGLQEVTTIRIQSPGDFVVGGTTPATTVLFNYLDILLDAISARGSYYKVVAVVQNFDVEVPMLVSVDPLAFDDIRATDFDVILAREDVETSNTVADNFHAELPVAQLGITIPRGYVAADVRIQNRTYRFVNTHLESFSELVRFAQAQELLSLLASETKPVIMAGDFNTPASDGSTYQFILSQGYQDAWVSNLIGNQGTGNTSLMAPDLRNEVPTLFERIDFIFVRTSGNVGRHPIGPVQAWVVGDELKDRTPSGLWPSDHAGVIAQLHVSQVGF